MVPDKASYYEKLEVITTGTEKDEVIVAFYYIISHITNWHVFINISICSTRFSFIFPEKLCSRAKMIFTCEVHAHTQEFSI